MLACLPSWPNRNRRVSEDGLNAKEEDLTLLFDILQLLEQQSDASIVTWVEEHLELLGDVEKAEGTR